MKSAVLFLVFNRPDTTRQVFDTIRAARPPKLYVAADGPRPNRAGEAERCAEVRRIATNVDWPCEVKMLFRELNFGCKMGVSGGINWFFEHEPEGIILEDDVLPVASFFDYCDELLERYRNDERVALVSGCNLVSRRFKPKESYFFSRYNHIWGWASWRRAWQHYDVTMEDWPNWRDTGSLARIGNGSRLFTAYWRELFDKMHRGEIDTWDYQWTFTCWRLGMLSILPSENQTHNLGFGTDATHTLAETPDCVAESMPKELEFPLAHPNTVERQVEADKLLDERVFNLNLKSFLKCKLQKNSTFKKYQRIANQIINKIFIL